MCNRIKIKFYLLFLVLVTTVVNADLQDPTRPADYVVDETGVVSHFKTSEENSRFVLNEILISGDSKLAIVNDHVVRVNDKVGDSTVKSIDSYEVILTGPKGQVKLHLFGNPIKEPSK